VRSLKIEHGSPCRRGRVAVGGYRRRSVISSTWASLETVGQDRRWAPAAAAAAPYERVVLPVTEGNGVSRARMVAAWKQMAFCLRSKHLCRDLQRVDQREKIQGN
jgi:hypothetical protein